MTMTLEPPRLALPRYQSTPSAGRSYGPAAVEWARAYLLTPSAEPVTLLPWQRRVLNAILACDDEGELVHRTYLMGTGRQNGKSTLMRVLVGWLLDASPWGGLALGAAFDKAQAGIIYRQVAADFRASADLRTRYKVTDHQGIRSDRSEYRVVSAESRAARGYSARLVTFDEVMTQRTDALWSALFPATTAVKGTMVALSTAGDEHSTLLRSLYDRMVAIETGQAEPDPAFGYSWWEAPSDDPDDPANLYAANPSLVEGLLPMDAIEAERGILSPAAFARERLNRFTSTRDDLFPSGEWRKGIVNSAPAHGTYAVAVDAVNSWERATVAIAVEGSDERVHVEVARDLRAEAGERLDPRRVALAAVDVADRFDAPLVWEDRSAIAPHLRDLALDAERHSEGYAASKVRKACGTFYSLVLGERLSHLDDPLLDQQLGDAVRSEHEGDWRFVRRRSQGHIDALLAVAYAAYAATEPPEPPAPVPMVW